MTEGEFASWLARRAASVRTPAYIYSQPLIEESLAGLRSLFPDDTRVLYALKANPQPGVVRHLAGLGVGAEIASAGERHMCEVAGVRGEEILIGGVSKSAEYLAAMCELGNAGLVIESLGEWRRLRTILAPRRQASILLRVNPGVALGGLDMAGDSQFGLDPGQAMDIVRECRSMRDVEFRGLHFYFGSQRLTPEPVLKMVDAAGQVLEQFLHESLPVPVVDLGLGCGVPYLEKDASLDFDDLRVRLQSRWQQPPWSSVRLWTEAGRALVARSGFYVSRVLERKVRGGKVFICLDGGLHTHNPGIGVGRFFRSNPRFMFVGPNGRKSPCDAEHADIVGNLCTSADLLGGKVAVPALEEGDLVVIPNAGAYCQTTGLWGFNGQPLFREAMLTLAGELIEVEPQYKVLLDRAQ